MCAPAPRQVRFEWIDWQGDCVPYAELPAARDLADALSAEAESFFEVDTWSLHPWRVVEAGTEIEVARVVFHKSCAVKVSEIARAAGSVSSDATACCAGMQMTLDILAEKQLAFAMAEILKSQCPVLLLHTKD